MLFSQSEKSHRKKNRGGWTLFHPPPQQAIIFKLERTSYIAHELTNDYGKG